METVLIKQELKQKKLIISISDNFLLIDFVKLFASIIRLYQFYYLYHENLEQFRNYNYKEFFVLHATSILTNNHESIYNYSKPYVLNPNSLIVDKIDFNSPGSIDLLGLGELFKMIKEIIIHYIPNFENHAETKLKLNELLLKEKEIEKLEQEIIATKIKNYKEIGLNTLEIQTILGLESSNIKQIKTFALNHKITNIEIQEINK